MSAFTAEEIDYLQSMRLGRLATIGGNGDLHVVPIAYRYNPEADAIHIGGHGFTDSKKYRDALKHGRAAIVIDDVSPERNPRIVEVRGTVQLLDSGGELISPSFPPEIIRISPTYIVSLGLVDTDVRPADGVVNFHGRRVE